MSRLGLGERDDAHIFLEDPWIHWPNKQGKLNRKAPIALGEAELAYRHSNSSKFIDFCGPQKYSRLTLLSALLQSVVAPVFKLQRPRGAG